MATALIGKNDWLFLTNDTNDVIGQITGKKPLTEAEKDMWLKEINRRYEYCQTKGIRYKFIIMPNKECVYNEYLPDDIIVSDNRPALQLSSASRIIDYPLEFFAHLKALNVDYYHKNDTHWTELGALRFLENMLGKILDTSLYEIVKKDFVGDLGNKINPHKICTTNVVRFIKDITTKIYDNGVENRGKNICYVNKNKDLPVGIIFGDSFFGDSPSGHFLKTASCFFSELYYFNSPHSFDLDIIQKIKPDLIINEIVERFVEHPQFPTYYETFDNKFYTNNYSMMNKECRNVNFRTSQYNKTQINYDNLSEYFENVILKSKTEPEFLWNRHIELQKSEKYNFEKRVFSKNFWTINKTAEKNFKGWGVSFYINDITPIPNFICFYLTDLPDNTNIKLSLFKIDENKDMFDIDNLPLICEKTFPVSQLPKHSQGIFYFDISNFPIEKNIPYCITIQGDKYLGMGEAISNFSRYDYNLRGFFSWDNSKYHAISRAAALWFDFTQYAANSIYSGLIQSLDKFEDKNIFTYKFNDNPPLTTDKLLYSFYHMPNLIQDVFTFNRKGGCPWLSWLEVAERIDNFLCNENFQFEPDKEIMHFNFNVAYFAPKSFFALPDSAIIEIISKLDNSQQRNLLNRNTFEYIFNLVIRNFSNDSFVIKFGLSFWIDFLFQLDISHYRSVEKEVKILKRLIAVFEYEDKNESESIIYTMIIYRKNSLLNLNRKTIASKNSSSSSRIALIIAGQLRGFEESMPKFINKFGHLGLIDVYVSTWNSIGFTTLCYGSLPRLLDKDAYDYVIKNLDNIDIGKSDEKLRRMPQACLSDEEIKEKLFRILSGYNNVSINVLDDRKKPFSEMSNPEKMYYHNYYWIHKKGYDFFNSNYDFIIKIRPDYNFLDLSPIDISQIKNGYIFTDSIAEPIRTFMGDQMIIATAQDGCRLLSCYAKTSLSYLYLGKYRGHTNLATEAWLEGIITLKDISIAKHSLSDAKKLTKQDIQECLVFHKN